MGVDLKDLIQPKDIELQNLGGKKIAIDALNTIYQFLSIIRQRDGTPLMDSEGNVTSHLSGLFYRNIRLLEYGILPCYVFDGKPPQLKAETVTERKKVREEAREKWKQALKKGDLAEARTQAQRASKVNEQMLKESKKVLEALGLPYVQAPSEGEAQAAYICQKKEVYAVGSQDFDALLFGSPILLRNITITGKRKVPRKDQYIDIKSELIELDSMLKELKITQEQLIGIGILMGTDFNPGIKGIGPKKALEKIKENSLQKLKKELDFAVDPLEVKKIFTNPEITQKYTLKWNEPDQEKLIKILHEKHDFSEERIKNAMEKLEESKSARDQKSLSEWV